MKKATFAAVAVLLAVPSVGMAQGTMGSMKSAVTGPDSGWYAGGSLGQSKGDCGSGFAGSSCDDSDTAFKIFGGYQFNKYLGAELGYAALGDVKATFPTGDVTVEAKAWDVMAVGTFPVADRFNVFGKLGWFRADSDASGLASGSDSSSGLTYAIGAGYDFTRNFGLRAEWQRYTDVGGNNVGGETDADVMSIGVVYRFK